MEREDLQKDLRKLGDDGYVLNLDGGDGFTCVYICQNLIYTP